jgi:hypothetical protein
LPSWQTHVVVNESSVFALGVGYSGVFPLVHLLVRVVTVKGVLCACVCRKWVSIDMLSKQRVCLC